VVILRDGGSNIENIQKSRETEGHGEIGNNLEKSNCKTKWCVESLEKVFDGCRGVFHTSAFSYPAGLSRYTLSFFLCLCLLVSLIKKFLFPFYFIYASSTSVLKTDSIINSRDKSSKSLVKQLVIG